MAGHNASTNGNRHPYSRVDKWTGDDNLIFWHNSKYSAKEQQRLDNELLAWIEKHTRSRMQFAKFKNEK